MNDAPLAAAALAWLTVVSVVAPLALMLLFALAIAVQRLRAPRDAAEREEPPHT